MEGGGGKGHVETGGTGLRSRCCEGYREALDRYGVGAVQSLVKEKAGKESQRGKGFFFFCSFSLLLSVAHSRASFPCLFQGNLSTTVLSCIQYLACNCSQQNKG